MEINEAKEFLEKMGYKVISNSSSNTSLSTLSIFTQSDDLFVKYITNSDLNGNINKHDINVWNGEGDISITPYRAPKNTKIDIETIQDNNIGKTDYKFYLDNTSYSDEYMICYYYDWWNCGYHYCYYYLAKIINKNIYSIIDVSSSGNLNGYISYRPYFNYIN